MERPIIEIDEEKCDGCGQCVLDCAEGALAVVDGKARLIRDSYCDGQARPQGCPGSRVRTFAVPGNAAAPALTPLISAAGNDVPPSLRARTPSWPIQLRLLPPQAPFLSGAHVLLAAQCAGFVLPGLHDDWLQGRIPVIACPKLDNNGDYAERLTRLFAMRPASVTLLRMSVPCCAALEHLARQAQEAAGSHAALQCHTVHLPR